MLDPSAYDFCSEFYIVVKAIEVFVSIDGESQKIRIEALYGPDSTTRYSTRACYNTGWDTTDTARASIPGAT